MRKTPLSGRVDQRNRNISTTYSEGYNLTAEWLRSETWYDVWPYSLTLWPHHFAEIRRHGAWWIQRRNNSFITLELTLKGEIIFEGGKQKEPIRRGEMHATWPGDSITMRPGDNGETLQYQLILSGGATRLLSESLGLAGISRFRFGSDEELNDIRSRMSKIAQLLRRKTAEKAPKLSSLCYDLLLYLAGKSQRAHADGLPGVLTNAIMNMEADRYCSTSVAEQAAALGVSRATLGRLFRDHLGTTPHDYQKQLRMESAKQLLDNPAFPVKEIAARLGFSTPFAFSAAFRNYCGVSPSAFRKESRKEKKNGI